MNEGGLRWKGRIGSMKIGCGIVLLIAIFVACMAGVAISTALQNPDTPRLSGNFVILMIALVIAGVCIVPFFFPGVLFAPQPLDATVAPPAVRQALKATGAFQRLKSIDPLEMGKGTQKFNSAVANFIPRAERDVMIYIHQIVTTKRYGITLSRRETDWGAFLNGENVQAVEAGKLYGWKDKWAIHFLYTNAKGKADHLYLIFEGAGGQVEVARHLEQLRFQVHTGETLT